jgi:hypothetical protein
MASILRVNTLTDASSGNSTAMSTINQGTAKAWINFNGTSTIATRDSFNVSSIADDGTGTYTITINNDMANADYCTTSGVGRGGLATCTFLNDGTWATTAGSGQVICANSSNAAFDPPAVLASFLGDLA